MAGSEAPGESRAATGKSESEWTAMTAAASTTRSRATRMTVNSGTARRPVPVLVCTLATGSGPRVRDRAGTEGHWHAPRLGRSSCSCSQVAAGRTLASAMCGLGGGPAGSVQSFRPGLFGALHTFARVSTSITSTVQDRDPVVASEAQA